MTANRLRRKGKAHYFRAPDPGDRFPSVPRWVPFDRPKWGIADKAATGREEGALCSKGRARRRGPSAPGQRRLAEGDSRSVRTFAPDRPQVHPGWCQAPSGDPNPRSSIRTSPFWCAGGEKAVATPPSSSGRSGSGVSRVTHDAGGMGEAADVLSSATGSKTKPRARCTVHRRGAHVAAAPRQTSGGLRRHR